MRIRIAKPMMIENFQQFCLFECSNCLTRFIVVNQNDLQARWVENIALMRDAQIQTIFIHHPIIIMFIAQDTVERIANMCICCELCNGSVSRISAWSRHHLAYSCIARARPKYFSEIFEEAVSVDKAKRFS